MANKTKLKELLGKLKTLEGKLPLSDTRSYIDQIAKEESERFSENFKQNPTVRFLDGFNTKLEQFKRDFNLEPLISAVEKIQLELPAYQDSVRQEFENSNRASEAKYKELTALVEKSKKGLEKMTNTEVTNLITRLDVLQGELSYQSVDSTKKGQSLNSAVKALEERLNGAFKELKQQVMDRGDLSKSIDTRFKENVGLITKTTEALEELRKDFINRLNRGGSAHLQVNVNSSVASSRYADINFIGNTAIRWSVTDDNTNKRVNIVASLIAGGAGGGASVAGGITRVTSIISVSSTLGDTALNDLVIFANEGVAITLPTAVANLNQYTVKNVSASSVVVLADGVETIDGSASALLPTTNESLSFISDNSSWNVV